jgi:hypothetical protein
MDTEVSLVDHFLGSNIRLSMTTKRVPAVQHLSSQNTLTSSQTRNVIFVGHSLGGIIVKEASNADIYIE